MESEIDLLCAHYILDQHREVVKTDLFTWAFWFENFDNRLLAKSHIANSGLITTIFVGIGYELFETRLIWKEDEDKFWRYSTYKEAIDHHLELVSKWKRKGRETCQYSD